MDENSVELRRAQLSERICAWQEGKGHGVVVGGEKVLGWLRVDVDGW